ncbi:hypothetical protein LTR53_003774 [Teratosphaeriaceae sp. CCFEE 6253]|nr:hypothetical protein LTR53_003774 [Teratosphaeriaceae sp. CCFEE 6253]
MSVTRARPNSTASTTSTVSATSLLQDVPGAFPARFSSLGASPTASSAPGPDLSSSNPVSLSQAVHARRNDYVRPKTLRLKIGSWNVAAYKGAEKDVGGWFVQGKGVAEGLTGLNVGPEDEAGRMDGREDVAAQEARYARKQATIPHHDPGSLPGGEDVGLYVLCLQEVVDVNSISEALKPYTDPNVAGRWKTAMAVALPAGYALVAEQQLIGMLLLIYASPDVAGDVRSVSTTSVGTGIGGYMGNKGAVTARIVLGETTRLVFISCHLSAGADKAALERRNWDVGQIVSRTRFNPISDSMDLHQTTGEQIGDEDFAFWAGDLNYRITDIPGDDVRRLLMLHTRNEYDLSQRSAQKIEKELETATAAVKQRGDDRLSTHSTDSASTTTSSTDPRTSSDSRPSTDSTGPTTIVDDISATDDPASLQTTLASLLPHDELRQQIAARRAFHDGWREPAVAFLPTYKYDAGSVGVFDSSEKKRAPSWCDRILYRTRRDRLAYEAKCKEEEEARRKDEEMRASGQDEAGEDESILYDYDPDADGVELDLDMEGEDEGGESGEGNGEVVVTREGFEDELGVEVYASHQRVLSSDHKPLEAVFRLRYECVVPELKAQVHAEVAKSLDKAENDARPSLTVVVDRHRDSLTEHSDADPATFTGVWFADVRWAQAKHRFLTIANTGRVPASFTFVERPVAPPQSAGIAPKWINLKVGETPAASSSHATGAVTLEPGETCGVELEVRIFDLTTMHDLNEGLQEMDDILVLRVQGGRDHFVPVRGNWVPNSLGRGLERLTRLPEGGIRRLQGQRPGSRKGAREPSGGEAQPVRSASAPIALLRLTAEVEGLSARVVAEWDMIHPPPSSTSDPNVGDPPTPPWKVHHAWPFDEECWTERPTEHWAEALGEACNALDLDQPIEASLGDELPRMQRLYVLADLLMLFLKSMTDGIITVDLWAEVEKCMSDNEKSRNKPSMEAQRTAVQEALARWPIHGISFILVTSMMQRILQETTASLDGSREPAPLSPSKRVGTLRRMTGLGSLPAAPATEEGPRAMARVFADVMVRTPESTADKVRAAVQRRKVEMLELFLRKDGAD